MKHLVQDIYLDADSYSFMLKRKSISEKHKERFEIIGYHSSIEMVNKHLKTLCAMELVNRDWTRMMEMVDEIKLHNIKKSDI